MGGQRKPGHPWGAYIVFVFAIALIAFAGTARPGMSAQERCRPVALDVAGLPREVITDLREAAERTTAISGIPFVTIEDPSARRAIAVRLDTNLPVSTPGNKTVAYTRVVIDGQFVAQGSVSLDLSLTTGHGFARRRDVGAVLMHELGHVLGVAHSDDPRDLMFKTVGNAPPAWSDNDRARLAAVGAARGCGSSFTASRRS